MSGFVSEPPRSADEQEEASSIEPDDGNRAHAQGPGHDTSRAMTKALDGGDAPPFQDISASQKMLSAVTGSLLTSLLVTPLDVVRVRLQSQPQSSSSAGSSPLRTASFRPSSAGFSAAADLGVTACCREVFWTNNAAQYCLAGNSTAGAAAISASSASPFSSAGPMHVSAPLAASASIDGCAVEETRQRTFNSTLDGLRKIARNEGVFTLWRGLSPTLVMAVPANVIYFTGYDYLRAHPLSPIRRHVSDGYAPLVAGSIARVAAAVAVSPIEMFRTRMQAASTTTTLAGEGIFSATYSGLRDMVRAQGYASLWRGLTLTMWRDVPFSGFYWWGYEAARNALTDAREKRRQEQQQQQQRGRSPERGRDPVVVGGSGTDRESRREIRSRSRSQDNHSATFVDSFLAGAASGAVASLVTTPFDVGKTRQQVFVHARDTATAAATANTAAKTARELAPEERSMPRFLYHIWQTEGAAGLFRGWAARCLKVAPACAIMISSYEVGKKMAQRVNVRKEEKAAW